MNKILIVGHPQSGYAEVERLLHACGMARALPSRREGFTPEQINATLCKAHSATPLHRLGHGREVRQISTGPVWHGLAMDLMLGNIDQPLWGWADPQAIHLLEYWRDLDPTLHFILLYDRPHSVLTRSTLQDAATLTSEALKQRLDSWTTYNAALLHFHHRNPERSLLVNTEQVRQSAEDYLHQVRARIDAPWNERLENTRGEAVATSVLTIEAEPSEADGDGGSESVIGSQPLATFVANALVGAQTDILQLYEELQASANLPLDRDLTEGFDPALGMEAWHSMVEQKERLHVQHQLNRQLQVRQQEADQLARKRQDLLEAERQLRNSDAAQHQRDLVDAIRTREQVEASLVVARTQTDSAKSERAHLLQELHEAQEQLEVHFRQKRDLAASLKQEQQKALDAHNAEVIRLQNAVQLAAREREELKEKLNAATDHAKTQAHTGIPPMSMDPHRLLVELHEMQEALECAYLESKRLRDSGAAQETSAPSMPYASPETPWYGAGDRVRKQIEYRLGAEIIARSRTFKGCLTLPWALRDTLKKHRMAMHEPEQANLPPIDRYSDAAEAERVRQHLSYRLGATLLQNARTPVGWVRLPWIFRKEVKAFRSRQGQP